MSEKEEPTSTAREKQPAPYDSEGTSAAWIRHLQIDPNEHTVWSALSKRYLTRLEVFARQQLGPDLRRTCDPEDVINEAWMKVVARISKFEYRHRGSLYNWLCIQVKRVVLDRRRNVDRKGPDPKLAGDFTTSTPVPDPAADANGPATEAGYRDLKERLTSSLEEVPEPYRRVLVATFLEEKSRNEVAAELGRKPNTISQQIARGLDHWRRKFGSEPLKHV